jgi:hypothetical protein
MELVVLGAQMQCSFGTAPAALVVTPANKTSANFVPAATVNDYIPMTNIPTFVMCTTQSNPAVAAATSAAAGTPTPAPCVPATSSPWSPGSSAVKLNNIAALTNSCKCQCSYGGSISITNAGQQKVSLT